MTDNINKMIDDVYAVFPFVSINTDLNDATDAIIFKCRWYFRGREMKYSFMMPTWDDDTTLYEWTTANLIKTIAMSTREHLI